MPYDPLEFNYVPKHTADPLEPLDLKRPLTYVFRCMKPCCFGTEDTSLATGWDTESASSEDDQVSTAFHTAPHSLLLLLGLVLVLPAAYARLD